MSKKTVTKKPGVADAGVAALIEAERRKIEQERAEREARFPAYTEPAIIGNEEASVKTVHAIAKYCGTEKLSSGQVEQVASFVRSGQLSLDSQRGLVYALRRAIPTIDGKLQKEFIIAEVADEVMDEAGIDAFKIGMDFARGNADAVSAKDIRIIAGLAVSSPAFIGKMPTREVMAIYSLYSLFFLGR